MQYWITCDHILRRELYDDGLVAGLARRMAGAYNVSACSPCKPGTYSSISGPCFVPRLEFAPLTSFACLRSVFRRAGLSEY